MSSENNNDNLLEKFINMSAETGEMKDPNYDEIMKNFKTGCPIKMINFMLGEPGSVAGMWLLSTIESINKIEPILTGNEDEYTILFFTNRHIVELSHILNGMLHLITDNGNILSDNKRMDCIKTYINYCMSHPDYLSYVSWCKSISSHFKLNATNEAENILYKNIGDIMAVLPFASYSNLDDLYKEAIDFFKDKYKTNE